MAECNVRVRDLIYELSGPLLARGIDVIWDFGYWKRVDRDKARKTAADLGSKIIFYNFLCSDEVALARNLARSTSEQPLEINENTYRTLKHFFEPMGPDEEAVVVDTTIS